MNEAAEHINTYAYGCIEIVVHRPALDEAERRKREATIQRAVMAYGKGTIRQKAVKLCER